MRVLRPHSHQPFAQVRAVEKPLQGFGGAVETFDDILGPTQIAGVHHGRVDRGSGRNEQARRYTVKDNQITKMAEYNVQVEPRN